MRAAFNNEKGVWRNVAEEFSKVLLLGWCVAFHTVQVANFTPSHFLLWKHSPHQRLLSFWSAVRTGQVAISILFLQYHAQNWPTNIWSNQTDEMHRLPAYFDNPAKNHNLWPNLIFWACAEYSFRIDSQSDLMGSLLIAVLCWPKGVQPLGKWMPGKHDSVLGLKTDLKWPFSMILQLDQKWNYYLSQYSHHLLHNKEDSQLQRRRKLGIWSDLDTLDNLIVKSKQS